MSYLLYPSFTSRGYTLVELSIVTLLIGIIGSLAIPPLLGQLRHLEAQQIDSELHNFLVNGKQEALIYHNPIVLCIADNNKQCLSQNGRFFLSFIDTNNNNSYEENIDQLLEHREIGLRFGKLITRISLNKNYVNMNANNGNPIGYMGHFKYCPDNGNASNMFKVTFSITGQIKTKYNRDSPTECMA